MRGAPQSGFSMLIRRISARRSASICGRPPNDRDFQRQQLRKPVRCQPTSVSGRIIKRTERIGSRLADICLDRAFANHLIGDAEISCACRKSNSDILVMKSAEKWRRHNATNGMNGAR